MSQFPSKCLRYEGPAQGLVCGVGMLAVFPNTQMSWVKPHLESGAQAGHWFIHVPVLQEEVYKHRPVCAYAKKPKPCVNSSKFWEHGEVSPSPIACTTVVV